MNTPQDPQWGARADQDGGAVPLPAPAADDFADFFNLDNLTASDLNMSLFGADGSLDQFQSQHAPSDPHGTDFAYPQGHDGLNTSVDSSRFPSREATSLPQTPFQHGFPYHHPKHFAPENPYAAQMSHVPPTPNSTQIHGQNAPYSHHPGSMMAHGPFDHRGLRSADLNALTPYISPELEGHADAMSYNGDYPIQSAYALSPIASPAINPQKKPDSNYSRSRPVTAESSVEPSPVEDNAQDGTSERPRKTRKKDTPAKSQSVSTRRKKSTATTSTTSHKRKESLSVSIPPSPSAASPKTMSAQELRELHKRTGSANLQTQSSASASSSISPRPLNEASMAPPAKPKATSSLTPKAKPLARDLLPNTVPPATPASMMRLQAAQASNDATRSPSALATGLESPATTALESSMEYLRLPESAAVSSPHAASHLNSAGSMETNIPPSLKSKQNSTTRTSNSTSGSPASSAVPSPAGPIGVSKQDSKGQKIGKKRESSTTNLVSPALRPKISPSVKPLLPEGSNIDAQRHALLLASRSNYQNILEGSHLPGVTYPSDLSANLTSKRTSHKIAEQGRRNRINTALQEMQALLPPDFVAASAAGVKCGSNESDTNGQPSNQPNGSKTPQTTAQAGNSKAATVECAIDYIKHLRIALEEKDSAIGNLQREIAELKMSE